MPPADRGKSEATYTERQADAISQRNLAPICFWFVDHIPTAV
jgi:hypothetical protein